MRAAAAALAARGAVRLPPDDAARAWARAALAAVRPILADPQIGARWLRCAGTWFAGVDVLPNDAAGAVGGVPLSGPGPDLVAALGWAPARWHAGQVSVVHPGYPRPREGESAGAARYRLRRDAAHVDGLLPIGPERRRHLREPHAFVLGLALTGGGREAAPLVVWEGSHRVMARAFRTALHPHPPAAWGEIDLTAAYHEARRAAFATCRRRRLPLPAGGAVLLHRLTLHGVAPWAAGAPGPVGGRAVAYFRPLLDDPRDWLDPAP